MVLALGEHLEPVAVGEVETVLRRGDVDLGAGATVLGPETRRGTPTPGVNSYVAAHSPGHVVIINPAAGALGRA